MQYQLLVAGFQRTAGNGNIRAVQAKAAKTGLRRQFLVVFKPELCGIAAVQYNAVFRQEFRRRVGVAVVGKLRRYALPRSGMPGVIGNHTGIHIVDQRQFLVSGRLFNFIFGGNTVHGQYQHIVLHFKMVHPQAAFLGVDKTKSGFNRLALGRGDGRRFVVGNRQFGRLNRIGPVKNSRYNFRAVYQVVYHRYIVKIGNRYAAVAQGTAPGAADIRKRKRVIVAYGRSVRKGDQQAGIFNNRALNRQGFDCATLRCSLHLQSGFGIACTGRNKVVKNGFNFYRFARRRFVYGCGV